MKKLILFFALMGGLTFFASAQSTPRVAKKQVKQNVRIDHGIANGELTRQEVRNLTRQQRHIQAEKKIAKADGIVTRREKAHIRQDQRVANRNIYRQKHDAQKRH